MNFGILKLCVEYTNSGPIEYILVGVTANLFEIAAETYQISKIKSIFLIWPIFNTKYLGSTKINLNFISKLKSMNRFQEQDGYH